MAGPQKSVFTDNSTGSGKSEGIVTKDIGHGQKIMSAYPQDNVSGVKLSDTRGGSFRGGVDNLKHSLSGGVSAVQDGPGAAGSSRKMRG